MNTSFVYFSDTHARSSTPRCRKDKLYYAMQLKKIEEAMGIVKDVGIGIHGGDLFDSHNSSLQLLSDTASLFRGLVVNPGNHDFSGANTETLCRSGVGLLESLGIISYSKNISIFKDERIVFRSAPYMIKYPEDFYWFENKEPGKVYVVLAHDMLVPHWVPFPHQDIHTLKTNADLVLCSHFHAQYIEQVNDTWFVNSGPLDAQTVHEVKVKPAVAVIDIKGSGKVFPEFRYLKTTGYEVVEATEEEQKDMGLADGFVKEIQSLGVAEGQDVIQLAFKIGKESGYSDELVQRVVDRIKNSQKCVEAV